MTPSRPRLSVTLACLALGVGAAGCAAEGTAVLGADMGAVAFHICGPDMGVYPDRSVLADPDNPFVDLRIGQDAKWDIESNAGPVAAFYAWATLTASQPSGESQFYAANNLAAIYRRELATEDQLAQARDLAIRAYQAVLDHFPDAVTYDASGTIAWNLATPAYDAIVALGGSVQGGWVIVETADGQRRALQP